MLALLCFDSGHNPEPAPPMVEAFRATGQPIVHVIDLGPRLAVELLLDESHRLDAGVLLAGGILVLFVRHDTKLERSVEGVHDLEVAEMAAAQG